MVGKKMVPRGVSGLEGLMANASLADSGVEDVDEWYIDVPYEGYYRLSASTESGGTFRAAFKPHRGDSTSERVVSVLGMASKHNRLVHVPNMVYRIGSSPSTVPGDTDMVVWTPPGIIAGFGKFKSYPSFVHLGAPTLERVLEDAAIVATADEPTQETPAKVKEKLAALKQRTKDKKEAAKLIEE